MTLAPGTRILMTTDAVGGVWTFTAGLAGAWAARDMEILLVSIGPRPSDTQRAMLGDGVSLIETDLELEWQDPAGLDLARAEATLRRIVRQFQPDLIHLNGYREATLDWPVPVVVVAHSCVTSWAEACRDTPAFEGPAWASYRQRVADGLARADAWAAPSASFRDCIARHYGVPHGRVIWNGAAEAEGGSPKQSVVLGAGRVWDRAKNLTLLAAIAPGVDWPIRIAGPSGRDGDMSGAKIGHCDMLGALSRQDMRSEMQRAAIFVSPALYEPFGLSVLEAAQAGCALVLSDIDTFRELWRGAALFVDPRDIEGWRQALQSLCTDAARREALQQAAVQRARRYPLRQTVDDYGLLYAQLLMRGRTATSPVYREARA